MSDYTPTTEHIRETWIHTLIEGCAHPEAKVDANWDDDRMAAQFDRWLAKRDAEAAERIAQAIEADMTHDAARNATLATAARIARGDT